MKVTDQYISVKVPVAEFEVSVKSTRFVVRNENGETLAQGMAVIEADVWSGEKTIVMSPEMVTNVFGHPTMQRLYEKYEQIIEEMDKAGVETNAQAAWRLLHKAMNEEVDGSFPDFLHDEIVAQNLASVSLDEDLPDQSEIADMLALDGCEIVEATQTGYSIFTDAIRKQGFVGGETDGDKEAEA
jgi:hypothetical protein